MMKSLGGSGNSAGIGLSRLLAGDGKRWRRNCDGATTRVK